MARLEWRGQQVGREVRAAGARGLFEAAEELLGYANETVPHEDGILEGSGETSLDADRLIAHVSYDTPYAVRQHEELDYRHDPGRRAKWLELSLEERRDDLIGHIAGTIRRAMGGAA